MSGDLSNEEDCRLRVVLDTNVLVGMFLHDVILPPQHPYTDILDAFFDGKFAPIYCAETRDELDVVLKYAKSVGRKYNISPDLVDEFIQSVLQDEHAGILVTITSEIFVSSDVDDDKFAEAAAVGGAAYLVTNDPHLHEQAVKGYLAGYKCRVLLPYQFRGVLRNIPALDDD